MSNTVAQMSLTDKTLDAINSLFNHMDFSKLNFEYYPSGNLKYIYDFPKKSCRTHKRLFFYDCSGEYLVFSGIYKNGLRYQGTNYRLYERRTNDDIRFEHIKAYEGRLNKNMKPTGYGKAYGFNGLIYCGTFFNGEYSGVGEQYANGQLIFRGIFKRSLKNGFGTEYENNVAIYKGNYRNDKKDNQEIITEMNIASFLETKDASKIKKVNLRLLRKYIDKKYNEKNTKLTRKQVISVIVDNYNKNKKELQQEESHENYDLFGNEIVNPCRGNDDILYDLSSMEYLFSKNDYGDYKNIKYVWSSSSQSYVPNFPILTKGIQLKSFTQL